MQSGKVGSILTLGMFMTLSGILGTPSARAEDSKDAQALIEALAIAKSAC